MPRIYQRVDPVERFNSKYRRKRNGCWQWTAGTSVMSQAGEKEWRYGWFRPGGTVQHVLAHRWSYQTHKGPIPVGMVLDHLCRNTLCVNPAHLEAVTVKQNINRGDNANARKTHCIRGHEFTPENTRIGLQRGNRICKQCKALHANAAYHGRTLGKE